MESTTSVPSRPTKTVLWAARIIGALAVLFWLFDTLSHFVRPEPVVDAFTRLGFPIALAPTIGALQVALIVLYLIPASRIISAILMTGYLGGAIAVNLRVGDPVFETLFPVIMGILLWGPPYLLDRRLRALIPVTRKSQPAHYDPSHA